MAQIPDWLAPHESHSQQIIEASLADSFAYDRLTELTETFGPRFSGSQNLEDAIDWIVDEMKKDGLENVHTQDVMVPVWKRGKESLQLVSPRPQDLPMLGLGGSIATPEEGITAEVVVVNNFEELDARLDDLKGKIILFRLPVSLDRSAHFQCRPLTPARCDTKKGLPRYLMPP